MAMVKEKKMKMRKMKLQKTAGTLKAGVEIRKMSTLEPELGVVGLGTISTVWSCELSVTNCPPSQ